GIPSRTITTGDSRARAKKFLRGLVRRHTDHNLFRDGGADFAVRLSITRRFRTYLLGNGSKRKLAKIREIAFAKKVRERLLDLLRLVDLSVFEPRLKLFNRNVYIHHLVGAFEKAVGNGFAHLDPG